LSPRARAGFIEPRIHHPRGTAQARSESTSIQEARWPASLRTLVREQPTVSRTFNYSVRHRTPGGGRATFHGARKCIIQGCGAAWVAGGALSLLRGNRRRAQAPSCGWQSAGLTSAAQQGLLGGANHERANNASTLRCLHALDIHSPCPAHVWEGGAGEAGPPTTGGPDGRPETTWKVTRKMSSRRPVIGAETDAVIRTDPLEERRRSTRGGFHGRRLIRHGHGQDLLQGRQSNCLIILSFSAPGVRDRERKGHENLHHLCRPCGTLFQPSLTRPPLVAGRCA
jgi:hypothetical protein